MGVTRCAHENEPAGQHACLEDGAALAFGYIDSGGYGILHDSYLKTWTTVPPPWAAGAVVPPACSELDNWRGAGLR